LAAVTSPAKAGAVKANAMARAKMESSVFMGLQVPLLGCHETHKEVTGSICPCPGAMPRVGSGDRGDQTTWQFPLDNGDLLIGGTLAIKRMIDASGA
jgi:hypothetical protein